MIIIESKTRVGKNLCETNSQNLILIWFMSQCLCPCKLKFKLSLWVCPFTSAGWSKLWWKAEQPGEILPVGFWIYVLQYFIITPLLNLCNLFEINHSPLCFRKRGHDLRYSPLNSIPLILWLNLQGLAA